MAGVRGGADHRHGVRVPWLRITDSRPTLGETEPDTLRFSREAHGGCRHALMKGDDRDRRGPLPQAPVPTR